MYKKQLSYTSKISVNKSIEGETIETKIERYLENKEPLTEGAPIIFTERIAGVLPSYDIRTDRFEIAVEGTDKIAKSYQAKREERHNPKEEPKVIDLNSGAESTQGQGGE